MIKGLDGLRGVAFLMIFFFHVGLMPFGWYSIQLFFVLSGFLITPILIRTKETHRENFYSHFIVRRAFRIFPLYYFYLLLLCVVGGGLLMANIFSEHVHSLFEQIPYAFMYLFNFVLIGNVDASKELPVLGHIWSLSVEEQFYLMWPFLILLCPTAKLRKVLLLVVLLGPVFRAVSMIWANNYFSGHASAEQLANHVVPSAVYLMPWSHCDAFAIGALFAMIRVPYAKQQFYLLLVLLPVVGLVTEYLATGSVIPAFLGFKLLMPDAYKPIWGYSLLNYLFALLVYMVARENRYLPLLEARAIRGIGKVSYGAYIYHVPVNLIFALVAKNYMTLEPGMQVGPLQLLIYFSGALLALATTIGIAVLSFKYLETPFMKIRERRYGEKRASPTIDLEQLKRERPEKVQQEGPGNEKRIVESAG